MLPGVAVWGRVLRISVPVVYILSQDLISPCFSLVEVDFRPPVFMGYTMTETIPPDGSKNKPKLGVSRPRITHKVCRGAGHVTEFLQKQVDLGVRGSDFMKELPKDARSDVKACLEYIRGLVTYGKAKFEGKTNDG